MDRLFQPTDLVLIGPIARPRLPDGVLTDPRSDLEISERPRDDAASGLRALVTAFTLPRRVDPVLFDDEVHHHGKDAIAHFVVRSALPRHRGLRHQPAEIGAHFLGQIAVPSGGLQRQLDPRLHAKVRTRLVPDASAQPASPRAHGQKGLRTVQGGRLIIVPGRSAAHDRPRLRRGAMGMILPPSPLVVRSTSRAHSWSARRFSSRYWYVS